MRHTRVLYAQQQHALPEGKRGKDACIRLPAMLVHRAHGRQVCLSKRVWEIPIVTPPIHTRQRVVLQYDPARVTRCLSRAALHALSARARSHNASECACHRDRVSSRENLINKDLITDPTLPRMPVLCPAAGCGHDEAVSFLSAVRLRGAPRSLAEEWEGVGEVPQRSLIGLCLARCGVQPRACRCGTSARNARTGGATTSRAPRTVAVGQSTPAPIAPSQTLSTAIQKASALRERAG